MNRIIRILKEWTLPVSMITGALIYIIGAKLPVEQSVKTGFIEFVEWLQPVMLFCMLFVAFCKVKPSDLRPHKWHAWLLLIQCGIFSLLTLSLWLFPETDFRLVIEGGMLAIICPTATACAVVTQKLGGDSATTTAYTIIINIAVAILAPLLLPIAHPQHGMTFLPAFIKIIHKVFPLLITPLLLAWVARYFLPRFHKAILSTRDLAFYMWAVSLAFAITVTVRALAHSDESMIHVGGIAIATMIACIFQFAVGKQIGAHYGMRLEGGQALGQKNTIFIIWLGYTFLSPITAVAGGFYSIWHNVINSYQLHEKNKKEKGKKKSGKQEE